MRRSGIAIGLMIVLIGALIIPAPVLSAEDDVDLAEYDAQIVPADREHWSFVPVTQPELPDVDNSEWVRTPIWKRRFPRGLPAPGEPGLTRLGFAQAPRRETCALSMYVGLIPQFSVDSLTASSAKVSSK